MSTLTEHDACKLVTALGRALRQWAGYADERRGNSELPDWIKEADDMEAILWQKAVRVHNEHCQMHERLPGRP